MKSHVFALLMIASLFLGAAGCDKHQNREAVPEAVIVQFDQDHAQADEVHWEPSERGFEATFEDGGLRKVALYSKKARPLRVEAVVAEKEVPVVVFTNLKKRYPKAEIEHIVLVEVPNRKPFYSMRARDPKAVFNIEISPKGIVLKRVVLERLVVIADRQEEEHDHNHAHCKHKHKKGKGHQKGHGHHKHDHHDDHHEKEERPGIVIRW